MARLAMTAAHQLGKDEAKRRLKDKLSFVLAKYGQNASDLQEAWHDHTLSFGFKTMGVRVKGTMEVDDDEVRLSGDVPFAVVIFKKRIERRIRAELGNLLQDGSGAVTDAASG